LAIKSENYAEEREIGPKLIFIASNFYGFPASFSPTSEICTFNYNEDEINRQAPGLYSLADRPGERRTRNYAFVD